MTCLDEHLDRDLLRARVVGRARRAFDRRGLVREAARLRLALGQAGAADLVVADLGDRGADHAGERGVAAGRVDPRDAALLVRVGARARSRPACREMRWNVSTQSPAAHTPSALVSCRRFGDDAAALADRRCRRRAASSLFGRTPMPSTTMSAGSVPSSVTTARTWSSLVGLEALHLGVGVQVDADAADRVGDERAHVGVERRHRLRRGFDDGDVHARASSSPRPSRARCSHRPRRRRGRASPTWSCSSMPSVIVWIPCTPRASTPGRSGRIGDAPVAMTSWSNGSSCSAARASRSTTVIVRCSRSMPTTSWRRRTSMPLARCSSGERAISWSMSSISPAT